MSDRSLTIPNLADPGTYRDEDLATVWRQLRAQDPVYRHPSTQFGPDFWVVSRHEDVSAVLGDPGAFTSEKGNVLVTLLAGGDTGAGRMLAVTDGARHAALRALLLRAFSPRALAAVARRIRQTVGDLLREAVAAGEGDFARDLTLGYGPHFCLGAYLGRVELTAVLEALATFASAITVTDRPRRIYSNFLSGMSSLPVALEAAPSPRWSA